MFNAALQAKLEKFVEIELFQSNSYIAGQPLFGKINLHAKDNINDVSQISLSLCGSEEIVLHLGKL